MKIGIDISQIVFKGSGVSRFTDGLVRSILQYEKRHHWTFYFSSLRQNLDPNLEKLIKAKGFSINKYLVPPTFLSFLFNDRVLPLNKVMHMNAEIKNLDWFITSDWTEPSLPIKKATIVHDLVFKKYPETVHPTILRTQGKRIAHVVQESNLIFADSHSTAHDLIEEYAVDKNKVKVNYPGVDTLEDSIDLNINIFEKYKIHKPYILTVGKLEPRKNIPKLIQAFKKMDTTAELVIVGSKGWGKEQNNENLNIKFLGFVPDEDLALLYSNALFFVYPSLYEGFGYPIIEAMRYRCPVATSKSSSMSEIAKDMALFFDPMDIKDMSNTMQKLFDDENLRTELIDKGQDTSSKYTWKQYYNTLIENLANH